MPPAEPLLTDVSGRSAGPGTPVLWGRSGLALGALALAGFGWLAAAGPSVVQPALPGDGGPWSFHAGQSAGPAILIMAAALVLAGAGLGCCLYAVRRGWRPRPAWLLAVGVGATVAFVLLPPVGSSDHLNYAAYGHMTATGLDPYATKASELAGNPYGDAVEEWRDTPSIYGPIVTAGQWIAAEIGGDSVRTTVFVLSAFNGLAFLLAGLVLYFRTRDPDARLRAVLLWTANPLLLFHLVSGAHNDVWAIAAAVVALTVFTRGASNLWRTFGTGLVVGAAVAIKLPAGLVGGGPAWHFWRQGRDRRSLAALFGGAALAAGTAYALAGPHGLDQVRKASDFVALANPWHLIGGAGHGVLNLNIPKPVISLLSLALLIYLVRLLSQALPQADDRDVLRVAAALVLGWLFAASYVLPWYDGLGYAVLAFLPWSRFDGVLVLRTTLLSLGYLPARSPVTSGLPGDLGWLITVLRAEIMPCALAAVLILLIWTARRRVRDGRRAPAPAP